MQVCKCASVCRWEMLCYVMLCTCTLECFDASRRICKHTSRLNVVAGSRLTVGDSFSDDTAVITAEQVVCVLIDLRILRRTREEII